MHKKYPLFLLLLVLIIVPSTYASDDDPLEPMNRAIFEFNEIVDDNVLKPIAKGYKYVTPDPVEVGISNFFSNLGEIGTITNDLLQLKFAQAGRDTMRFFLNSTLGIFGIFDVATPLGLSKNKEDFGQTLGFWGVPDGPYLVLPFLGPSSFRDGPSMIVDYELSPVEQLHHEERQVLQTLDIVDTRARLLRATKILDTAAKDKYIFIRESYLQKRESQVNDGNVKEEFEIDVHSVDY
ncbi:MAG: VacJ family lipoprotein [Pseudomonadota bacterium]|nr:VacJ family lipoprotein [Pseudomonadota bacterium]